MGIKFKAKIWKAGGSFVVTIPRPYINNKILPLDEELEFEFIGVTDEE
jgi:hypothetical protein